MFADLVTGTAGDQIDKARLRAESKESNKKGN
jgi:hypothetical protein